MAYPNMAPHTDARVQLRANLNALARAPRTRAMSKASGGIGKKEDSAKESTNKATAPYRVSAQCSIQSYNCLKNLIHSLLAYGLSTVPGQANSILMLCT